MKNLILLSSIALTLASCDLPKKATESSIDNTEHSNNKGKRQTIDTEYLDVEISPRTDFFNYANGSWLVKNPVPASESRWGSFNELDQSNKKKLAVILTDAKNADAPKGTMLQILGDYYASYIDMDRRNELGMQSIKADLAEIDQLESKDRLITLISNLHSKGVHPFFYFGVGQDLMNVDYHSVNFYQAGIGLPNKDYYIESDKADILDQYREHLITLFSKCESNESSTLIADDVLSIERQLAKAMMSRAEQRVPENTYNKFSKEDFILNAGALNIEEYIANIGIGNFDSIIVGQPKFLTQLGNLIQNTELSVIKNYLKWNVLNHYAGHLSDEFVQANFDFYGGVLTGKSEMKPIGDRATNEITNMAFGELLGKAFVGRHFSDEAQLRVNKMVDNLLVVFKERIDALNWMSVDTKKQATIKLNAIGRKLGFPNKWEDFSDLSFSATDYIGNINQSAVRSHRKNLAKLNKKVDKEEWGMPAHMVNAYYHPLLNEIAFPAGIMQEPFFSNNYEDAVNYGRIGMVIGHEFTHGFDDMGSKFAADGTFRNWWTEQDLAAFKERTEKLGETFAGFCPIEGHCVNSDLTMGENIADLGGLTMAYYAYAKTDEFKLAKTRNGFTPAQRFFIAYAQLWKINYTDEELKNRIANDPHSPGMYRVNGPLMNCPEFFDAFNVQEGDEMRNSKDKISKIW
ncbi:MAG: M13 family metallopeptidase [Crocinitomicaceae bacterium]|nr:M13 family metallopeptidase [Crocinitomicaceae bacterium]